MQRNFCVSFRRKCMKNYLQRLTEKSLTTNRSFWKFIKPFLTNKGFIGNNDIALIHKNKIISDEKQLTKLFNNFEKFQHKLLKRAVALNQKPLAQILKTPAQSVRDVVNSYKNHPSITKIKPVVNGSDVSDSERFFFKMVNESDLKNLDIKKT